MLCLIWDLNLYLRFCLQRGKEKSREEDVKGKESNGGFDYSDILTLHEVPLIHPFVSIYSSFPAIHSFGDTLPFPSNRPIYSNLQEIKLNPTKNISTDKQKLRVHNMRLVEVKEGYTIRKYLPSSLVTPISLSYFTQCPFPIPSHAYQLFPFPFFPIFPLSWSILLPSRFLFSHTPFDSWTIASSRYPFPSPSNSVPLSDPNSNQLTISLFSSSNPQSNIRKQYETKSYPHHIISHPF